MKKQIFIIIILLICNNIIFGQFQFNATGSNDMRLRTGNLDRLNILTNGRVGIGTAAPSSLFHTFVGDAGLVTPRTGTIGTFETNGTGYLSILTPNTATAGLAFGSPDGSADGSINYNHSTQKLTLNTKATTRMTIDSVGFVGIGDTSPEVSLDVNGAVHIQKDLLLKERLLQPSTSAIYDPFDRQDRSFVTIEPSTNVTTTINGFTAPTTNATFGTVLYVSNGSTGSIVLKNNAATVQNNRIITNTGADVTITGRGGAILIFDFTGWRLIAYAE
jgi:trimeric autotransporter adhesin